MTTVYCLIGDCVAGEGVDLESAGKSAIDRGAPEGPCWWGVPPADADGCEIPRLGSVADVSRWTEVHSDRDLELAQDEEGAA